MTEDLTIYISGLYSGTNPQPGIGIARSIRLAYPDAKIIGVEYSNRCSGIHWHDFDDIWLQRPWQEINLDSHGEEIGKILDSGAMWISSIDLEIIWLADVFPLGHRNLLTPPKAGLSRIGKPAIPAFTGLPVKIPTFVTTEISDWELHAFCREHDWKVWLKGPYYEAVRTSTWAEFEHYRRVMANAWHTDKLFLQSHKTGYEESVMLSAYQGELLDCVYMRKRDLTEKSKTWAGDVADVPKEIIIPLRQIIRELKWSGGAELEMVRDAKDDLWLLECNPRFPAWVHGATITGRNLPGLLVEGASGIPSQDSPSQGDEFTRVVLEVPVNPEFPLPPLPEPYGGAIGHSLKHPSGLLQFAGRLHKTETQLAAKTNGSCTKPISGRNVIPQTFLNDLSGVDISGLQTPASIFFESTAAEYFTNAAKLSGSLSGPDLKVINAYSIKTNPDERLLKIALESGFLAEAISLHEVHKALSVGFKPEQVILNGPTKWWRRETLPADRFYSVFCDSVEELEQVIEEVNSGRVTTEFLGVRLRTPNIVSRFGIPIDSPDVFERLIEAIGKMPRSCKFGVHFHMASSNVGVGNWGHLFESMLRWCSSIEALTGRIIQCLDVGGGWFPDDMQRDSGSEYKKAINRISEVLPNVRVIIAEPGKAMAQPSMALAMQILEIRQAEGKAREVIMDGSIAELPMHFVHPHRILCRDEEMDTWKSLERGKSVLFGRLCMEHDIVASDVELPSNAKVGDVLVFCDAGAYDRSMSYVFGCG